MAALAAISGILAACSGQAGTVPTSPSLPSSAQIAPAAPHSVPASAFLFRGDDGRLVHYFPTHSDAARHAASIPPPASNLLYGGGPIQPNPKVYIVFWGSTWNKSTGDPDGVGTLLKNFLSGWNGANWPSTMTQYYGPSGTYINDDTVLAGSYVDTSSTPPSRPGNSAIANEAKKAASHFGDYSVNASYVVALPHGHDPSGFATQWCAWHSDESAGSGVIAYTDLPYMPDGGANCGAGSVNSPGTDDGVTIVEGHEQGETETDPQPCSGWCDSGGSEIGDKCAWVNLQNTAFTNGTYPTQPLWSNKNNGCVQ